MARDFDKWRKLSEEELVRALVRVGIPRDAAVEYLDDPNAIPRSIRAKLNKYIESKTKSDTV